MPSGTPFRLPTVLEAPAKLTLSLRIVGTRPDGYHLLDAEMVAVDLFDELHLDHGDGLQIVGDDAVASSAGEENLVTRALRDVDRRVHARLVKRIPPGAGLGGGSADAAAVLRWAGVDDLERAARLGADVPFCLVGGRARVGGIGEHVEPLPYEQATFTLLTPPFGCSTPAVYRRWDELGGPRAEDAVDGPNDLECAALDLEPRLAAYRDQLEEASGARAQLAGSGSTWFVRGAFPGEGRVVVTTLPAPS